MISAVDTMNLLTLLLEW